MDNMGTNNAENMEVRVLNLEIKTNKLKDFSNKLAMTTQKITQNANESNMAIIEALNELTEGITEDMRRQVKEEVTSSTIFLDQQITKKDSENKKAIEEIKNTTVNIDTFEEYKNEINLKTDVIITKKRLEYHAKAHVNQDEFGSSFDVKLSRISVGKLFRIIGLARIDIEETTPYASALQNGYAMSDIVDKKGLHIHYKWNYVKCLDKLERWLESNNLKEKFYSNGTYNSLKQFVDRIYKIYILDKKK